ncbi:interleukin-1 receptor-associated kinase 1 isoform X1 [Xiphophorus maculatus]|uniref:interleukin-1 receptor-associated kinase 1 isoform X1 n=1 Tax=Xiphophorus maculatus TaxID=8083 RepID=UPI000C6CB9E6|nr:interleukin-1 receptor-associated kinase 1 isoform X1 [Xiphophorus maculatus]
MSEGDPRTYFLFQLPSSVHCEFCRVMDGLLDLDWTRFASEILRDQTAVRLAYRREQRTDWVMNNWGNRNGRVGELVDLLESLQLFRPRDIILSWMQNLSCPPPLPPALPPPPYEPSAAQSTAECPDRKPLPGPAPPPINLFSENHRPPPRLPAATDDVMPPSPSPCGAITTIICWTYEEVHAGTRGFSPSLQVGEGGFGVVYRATLSNMDCAVKRLRQDGQMDWTLLRKSFQTEVENLSKFRHPNIVDLLGFSEGEGGLMCLIYSYMQNRSLEDQLQNVTRLHAASMLPSVWMQGDCAFMVMWTKTACFDWVTVRVVVSCQDALCVPVVAMFVLLQVCFHLVQSYACIFQALGLSWPDRVSIIEGAAAALQFLHRPPSRQEPLIHGDVKSSNILLDQHLVPKLSDFGLARYVPQNSAGCSTQTASVGKTTTVRGTLAYLPDEYVRRGELCTAVDVYSYGVVLLEVLTGRRALEQDERTGDRFLRDLVEEVDDGKKGSAPDAWRRHLDQRLTAGGAAEPEGYLQVAALARKCLNRQRKKRPAMTEVFCHLKDLCCVVRKNSSSSSAPRLPQQPYHSFPKPPRSLDSCVKAISQQLSRLGPSEQTCPSSQYDSSSSSSSSSFGALAPPHPLQSCLGSVSPSSSPCPSLAGPCETDESRGFSQYDFQFRSNGTSCRTQSQNPAGSAESQLTQPSVPTEDLYNFPSSPSSGAGPAAAGFSPARSLQSTTAGLSVLVNPSKQRLLEQKSRYEAGWIRTPELLSLDDLYGGRSAADLRGPEESDELEYLPSGRS